VTFSLSNLAMTRFWVKHRAEHDGWVRHTFAHVLALALCATILVITTIEKFTEGGWVTLVVTTGLIALCFGIKRHYQLVVRAIGQLDVDLPSPPECEAVEIVRAPEAEKPVAILMVGGYSGLGRHALLTLLRMFPHHFSGVVFVSVAVVDAESFKGPDQIAKLEERTRDALRRYERYAHTLDLAATSVLAIGTEVPVEAEKIAEDLVKRFPRALFVAGQIIFEEETVANRLLHNETALMVQSRLQRRGFPMIVVPVRIDLRARKPVPAPKLVA
jgi:hypothetical protein